MASCEKVKFKSMFIARRKEAKTSVVVEMCLLRTGMMRLESWSSDQSRLKGRFLVLSRNKVEFTSSLYSFKTLFWSRGKIFSSSVITLPLAFTPVINGETKIGGPRLRKDWGSSVSRFFRPMPVITGHFSCRRFSPVIKLKKWLVTARKSKNSLDDLWCRLKV